MTAKLKVRMNATMSGWEALCLTCRFEPLDLPFSSSCRLVRNLRPVVQITALPVLDLGQDFPFGRRITLQLVRHNHPGRFGLAAE